MKGLFSFPVMSSWHIEFKNGLKLGEAEEVESEILKKRAIERLHIFPNRSDWPTRSFLYVLAVNSGVFFFFFFDGLQCSQYWICVKMWNMETHNK